MLKSKSFYICMIIVGACLFVLALLGKFMFEMPKLTAGVCLGIGTVLLYIGLPKLIIKYYETSQPEMMKQNQIELHDERNTLIRNSAKAKTNDIIQWFIIGLIYVTIIAEAPLWTTVAVVGIFLLQNLLYLFFSIKYQKEL